METYASIVSRSLGAAYHVAAWSGRGVVRNYAAPNITSKDTMPDLMLRTLATGGAFISFSMRTRSHLLKGNAATMLRFFSVKFVGLELVGSRRGSVQSRHQ